MKLPDLRLSAYRTYCDARAIDRMISTAEFGELWEEALESERAILEQHVVNVDRLAVASWIRTQERREVDGKTLRELRVLAAKAGIPHVNMRSKDDLISLLGGAA